MRLAMCNILDGWGNVVTDKGKPVEVCRTIPDKPPEELKKWAKSECLKFIRWRLK